MKKIIAIVFLLTVVLSLSGSALAWYTPSNDNIYRFNINNVQCVNTSTLKYWDYGGLMGSNTGSDVPYKEHPDHNYYESGWDTSGRLYVYHTITGGGGNAYTNLFHAVRIGGDMDPYGALCGQKWVTPQMWIPIESTPAAMPYECHYSVAVRGNTKHYENYGATSIDFAIRVEPNQ